MIQRIFPRHGERGGLSHPARAPRLGGEGGKITLQARSRELRATGPTGRTSLLARRADRDDEDREAARAQIAMTIART
jgi:hypothetical protein